MSESRDRILGRLTNVPGDRISVVAKSRFQSNVLWASFEEQLTALGGRIISDDELQEQLKKVAFVEEAAAKILQIKHKNEVDLWDVDVGISVADLAIAETGSLVVSAGLAKRRMSSLVPSANLMLISNRSIVGTIAEAIPLIGSRSSAIITGPSRTADIEGILVRGVHGPGELLVYVYG